MTTPTQPDAMRAVRRSGASSPPPNDAKPKKKTNYKAAWAETRKLMWQHRMSLGPASRRCCKPRALSLSRR